MGKMYSTDTWTENGLQMQMEIFSIVRVHVHIPEIISKITIKFEEMQKIAINHN